MLIIVHYKYILSTIISQYKKHNKQVIIEYIQLFIRKVQFNISIPNKRSTFYVSHSLVDRIH